MEFGKDCIRVRNFLGSVYGFLNLEIVIMKLFNVFMIDMIGE